MMNRLTWNEYPVMAGVAAVAGIALFLLLQTLGGAPAGEQPLKRSERTSPAAVLPPTTSQVEAARQDRAWRRAAARRRARAIARERQAAAAVAAAPAPLPSSDTGATGSYGSQPYGSGQDGASQDQSVPTQEPKPDPSPKPQTKKEPAPQPGSNFDDAG